MNEKFRHLSDLQLSQIIAAASNELRERLSKGAAKSSVTYKSVEKTVENIMTPPKADREYVLYIKALLRRGEYIRADDRVRVAEIAQDFPAWVQRQGLPTKSNTGPWNDARKRYSTPKEREL
ncbi:hypothetical protein [Alcaligenes aquatilis]|uniref:Uncharacterized protein n=1 Tax=Alcaligenes aquatilis TaxID=323284 RepID=A0A3G2HWY2_9BURK|nr:hypothetical protein [Alcaligenes aquatilis]AYN21574.1 hypothetical protein D3M96_14160 [Alcaligenes aquatilis]